MILSIVSILFSCFYYVSIRSLSLGTPFQYVFSISVALFLSTMNVKHYPRRKWRKGGRDEHKVEPNCVTVWDNKKYFKNHSTGSIIHVMIFYLNKKKLKKILNTSFVWTSRSVGGAKRIQIQNRNLQNEISFPSCQYASTCP